MKSMSNAISETEWKLFLNVMLKSNVHILFSLEEFDMLKELVEMKKKKSIDLKIISSTASFILFVLLNI